jgi:predicted nucleotidyltransferase component of viral defense system
MIPIALKLKKARHKEIAKLQDMIVEALYKAFEKAVIHGGTAIWRCYQGNRFSEDIDVYIIKKTDKINKLFDEFEKQGFLIKKRKVSENSIFSELEFNRVNVRFEAIFKEYHGVLKEYEASDSNLTTVYTLTPEELVKEKSNTYLKRLKVRDLYDVFFLLRQVKGKAEVTASIKKLVSQYKPPVDEKELQTIIITGLVPSPKEMLEYIRRWL